MIAAPAHEWIATPAHEWIAALAHEWRKLCTLRGTLLALVVVALGMAGLTGLDWYGVRLWESLPADRKGSMSVSPTDALAAELAQLCLGVVGVLAVTTEYVGGAIRTTLTVLPRRSRVVAAKAATVAAVALPTGFVAVYGSYWISRAVVGDRPIKLIIDPAWHTTPELLGNVLTVPAIAVTGVGLGLLLRSTPATITCLAVLLFVLPVVAQAVPGGPGDWLRSIELGALPAQLAGRDGSAYSVFSDRLTPLGAAAVLACYPALALAAGTAAMLRRDA